MLGQGDIMKVLTGLLVLGLVAVSLSSAIPKPDEHKSRVHDQDLSDVKHFDQDHDEDDEGHNKEYDHEAFLGKDEAKTFDQLSPEESKHRLGLIYDKIDSNKDGQVTEEELTNWIRYVQKRYIRDDADRQWKEHDAEGDSITFESYKKQTYGDLSENDEEDKDAGYNYKNMIERDRKRWAKADANKDGKLTKDEFADFLHPEDVPHMQDIVVEETMEDIDKDKDGFISLEEYIKDMWPNTDGKEEEPDWVKSEREQFSNHRDKNKDGRMDKEEVKEWIMPPDYDHSEAESKHLIGESDADADGKLTKEEVLQKYDLFVGSQATDFGEALQRHEEL